MSYTKEKIYNLALSSLLLAKEVANTDTDTSNEVRVLNTHWDTAFQSTLQDLDLDSLSTPITLELIAQLTEGPWAYVYKYPNNCIFLRRIQSNVKTDTRRTHIAKITGVYQGQKAIFTNEYQAIIECIPKDVPLAALTPMAAMAIAYMLAFLAAPLITGKGADKLRDKLQQNYQMAKTKAQETDGQENFNYESDDVRSEFVAARLE